MHEGAAFGRCLDIVVLLSGSIQEEVQAQRVVYGKRQAVCFFGDTTSSVKKYLQVLSLASSSCIWYSALLRESAR
jgi:hypothetical protein